MRKLVLVVAAGFMWLGFLALIPSPADAELKVGVTGNIRLNVVYTDVIAKNGNQQEIAPTDLTFTKGPGKNRETDNAQTAIDARRTRLQAVVSDEVGMTKLSAFIQTDFDTSGGTAVNSNSRLLRIRMAWAQAQTPTGWILRFGQMRTMVSEFGDNLFGGVGAPDVVDENGHWDQISARHPGIWAAWTTKTMGGDLIGGVGVEKAGTDLKSSTGSSLAATKVCSTASLSCAGTPGVNLDQGTGQDVPMFGAAARFRTPLWAVFARGAAQQQRVIFGPTGGATGGAKDGATTALTGWLGAITAEVTPGPLTVYAQYAYSEGLNRLIGNFSDVAMAQAVATNAVTGFGGSGGTGKANNVGHIRPITTNNWHAGAEYKLTKDLKAVVVYSFSDALPTRKIFDLTAASLDKRDFQAVHAGFGYTFWTRFNFGLEYQWGRVDSFGTSKGDLHAINSRLHMYF